MPNQDDQNQNQNQNTTPQSSAPPAIPTTGQDVMDVPPMVAMGNDIPQVPTTPVVSAPESTPQVEQPPFETQEAPPKEEEKKEEVGSAAPIEPQEDTTFISSKPKKKFGGGRIIATILGILVLVGGIAGGVILTQQQQDIRERAVGPKYEGPVPPDIFNDNNLPAGYNMEGCVVETKDENGNWVAQGRLEGCTSSGGGSEYNCPTGTVPNFKDTARSTYLCCRGNSCPYGNRVRRVGDCNCRIVDHKTDEVACDNNMQIAPCDTPITEYATCTSVKAYDSSWGILNSTQLAALKTGSVVNFCATGTTSVGAAGSFDRAEFTINGTKQAETTTKHPNGKDLCQRFTVPAGTTTFNVSARVHHTSLGWK